MQNNSRTTTNQPNRSTPQANQTTSSQYRTTGSQAGRTAPSQAERTTAPASTGQTKVVVCRKCKSPQIAANKRGYSFARLFKTMGWMFLLPGLILIGVTFLTGFLLVSSSSEISDVLIPIVIMMCGISMSLSLPVSILTGFIGRSELVNYCMNCGHKWMPAKKK